MNETKKKKKKKGRVIPGNTSSTLLKLLIFRNVLQNKDYTKLHKRLYQTKYCCTI